MQLSFYYLQKKHNLFIKWLKGYLKNDNDLPENGNQIEPDNINMQNMND